MSRNFTDRIVWQKAHAFVLSVYRLTASFPRDEQFGLTTQLRRAAVSIPANFAEGFRRTAFADKRRFYNYSQGSAEECKYYLILARELQYAEPSESERLLDEVIRLLAAYIETLRQRTAQQRRPPQPRADRNL